MVKTHSDKYIEQPEKSGFQKEEISPQQPEPLNFLGYRECAHVETVVLMSMSDFGKVGFHDMISPYQISENDKNIAVIDDKSLALKLVSDNIFNYLRFSEALKHDLDILKIVWKDPCFETKVGYFEPRYTNEEISRILAENDFERILYDLIDNGFYSNGIDGISFHSKGVTIGIREFHRDITIQTKISFDGCFMIITRTMELYLEKHPEKSETCISLLNQLKSLSDNDKLCIH